MTFLSHILIAPLTAVFFTAEQTSLFTQNTLPLGVETFFIHEQNHSIYSATNTLGAVVFTATYNPSGNLASRTDANGFKHTRTYDACERLTQISNADGSSYYFAYTSDYVGNLLTTTAYYLDHTFTYDTMNRVATARAKFYNTPANFPAFTTSFF